MLTVISKDFSNILSVRSYFFSLTCAITAVALAIIGSLTLFSHFGVVGGSIFLTISAIVTAIALYCSRKIQADRFPEEETPISIQLDEHEEIQEPETPSLFAYLTNPYPRNEETGNYAVSFIKRYGIFRGYTLLSPEGPFVDGERIHLDSHEEELYRFYFHNKLLPSTGISIGIQQSTVQQPEENHFQILPNELIFEIISYLKDEERFYFGLCCQKVQSIVQNSFFWKQFSPNQNIPLVCLHSLLCANGKAIQNLNLSNLLFDSNELIFLFKTIPLYCPHLNFLDLGRNALVSREIYSFAGTFFRFHHLQTLCLEGSISIGQRGTLALLRNLRQIPSLQSLNYSHNGFSAIEGHVFSDSIEHLTGLTDLNLSDNHLCSVEACIVSKTLSRCTSLLSLNMSGNTMTFGTLNFARSLIFLTNLTELNLENNQFGPHGASMIFPQISRLTSLKSLNFSKNSLTEHGVSDLAASLSQLIFLQRLDISDNFLGPRGNKLIVDSLSSSLNWLILRGNYIGEFGADSNLSSLSRLVSLTHLDVSENFMGVQGALCLTRLSALTSLVYLNLDFNSFGSEGVQAMALVMSNLTSLKHLSLEGNFLRTEDQNALYIFSQLDSLYI